MKIKIQELILGLALLPLTPLAAQAQFTFVTNNGAITITRYIGSGGAVVIPDTTNGYPVLSIGANAFANSSNLTSVIIPTSVTSIGDFAFYSCGRLTSANIPTSATNLGDYAFSGCRNLTSVTIPTSVTSIGYGAFAGCDGLTNVTIPNSVTSIGDRPFAVCHGLTNISVAADNPAYSSANGVLFDKAQAILIQFPGGRAGNYAIPNSVTSIGDGAFSGCWSLTSVTIPNSVTSIGQTAFSGCGSLTSVTIPNSVTSIGDAAFYGCGLTSVTIPDSVISMGDRAFYGCGGMTNVIIGNGVTSIGERAFSVCSVLTSATIGNSVTNIGDSAFHSCIRLTRVVIGNSVTRIGNSAFGSCWVLTSVTIPNSVTSIGGAAFGSCEALTSVTIPNSVTSIGVTAFANCDRLININVAADNPAYGSANGVLFDKAQAILIQFPGGRAGNYIIPNGVTRIANYAFASCQGLTSVTVPASVTSIGDQAFYHSGLTQITFLGNAPALGSFVFLDYALVYYYCGTSGWGASYGGLPTVMLFAPRIAPGSAGVKPGGFGFTLTCLTNQTIVVEASTNLVNWQPIWTNTLSGASADFVDPEWVNHPRRFYRSRSD